MSNRVRTGVVRRAAASATTDCTLAGVPTDTAFHGPDGDTAVRVQWPTEPVTGAELRLSPVTAEN